MNRLPEPFSPSRRQRGVALVMALVFLLLLTIIGIAALNTTSLEEKMANNVKDRNLAFQAAESALALGENWLYTQLGKPIFPNTGIGLHIPASGVTENWNDSTVWSGKSVTYPNMPGQSGSGTLGKINTQPKYIVEDMGEVQESGGSLVLSSSYRSKGTTILRVTARGTGGTDAAVVMLQSTYARDY